MMRFAAVALLLLAPAFGGAVRGTPEAAAAGAPALPDLGLSPEFDAHIDNMAGMWKDMQKDIKEKGMKNEMEHPDIKKFIEHKKKLADFAIEHHEGDKEALHKSDLWKKIQKHVHSKVFEPSEDL